MILNAFILLESIAKGEGWNIIASRIFYFRTLFSRIFSREGVAKMGSGCFKPYFSSQVCLFPPEWEVSTISIWAVVRTEIIVMLFLTFLDILLRLAQYFWLFEANLQWCLPSSKMALHNLFRPTCSVKLLEMVCSTYMGAYVAGSAILMKYTEKGIAYTVLWTSEALFGVWNENDPWSPSRCWAYKTTEQAHHCGLLKMDQGMLAAEGTAAICKVLAKGPSQRDALMLTRKERERRKSLWLVGLWFKNCCHRLTLRDTLANHRKRPLPFGRNSELLAHFKLAELLCASALEESENSTASSKLGK